MAEKIIDSHFTESPLSDEQEGWVNQQAQNEIDNLPWGKVIVVFIKPSPL